MDNLGLRFQVKKRIIADKASFAVAAFVVAETLAAVAFGFVAFDVAFENVPLYFKFNFKIILHLNKTKAETYEIKRFIVLKVKGYEVEIKRVGTFWCGLIEKLNKLTE